jgi:hypothetical protein
MPGSVSETCVTTRYLPPRHWSTRYAVQTFESQAIAGSDIQCDVLYKLLTIQGDIRTTRLVECVTSADFLHGPGAVSEIDLEAESDVYTSHLMRTSRFGRSALLLLLRINRWWLKAYQPGVCSG